MYTRAVDGMSDTPMVRAQVVHQELKSTLEFVFDDDEHTFEDDQLAKVTATYPSPTSQDMMKPPIRATPATKPLATKIPTQPA